MGTRAKDGIPVQQNILLRSSGEAKLNPSTWMSSRSMMDAFRQSKLSLTLKIIAHLSMHLALVPPYLHYGTLDSSRTFLRHLSCHLIMNDVNRTNQLLREAGRRCHTRQRLLPALTTNINNPNTTVRHRIRGGAVDMSRVSSMKIEHIRNDMAQRPRQFKISVHAAQTRVPPTPLSR